MQKRMRTAVMIGLMAAALVGVPVGGHASALRGYDRRCGAKASPGSRRGRPRKFSRPSRAITLTLPNDVIATLQAMDPDLGCAIVRTVERLGPEAPRPRAELAPYGNRAVIIVSRTRVLKERTGVDLVPLSDGRALITFDDRLSIPQFELRLLDALADPALEGEDRATFEALVDILRNARRGGDVALRQANIIVLQWTRPSAGSIDEAADTREAV